VEKIEGKESAIRGVGGIQRGNEFRRCILYRMLWGISMGSETVEGIILNHIHGRL